MPKLTALSVRNAGPGRHADGEGLYLLVKPSGARSWVLRIQADGKRRDVGLGSVNLASKAATSGAEIEIPILHHRILTLAQAREKAAILRTAAKAGLDPVIERDRERRTVPSFSDAAKAAHQALKDGWTDKGASVFLRSLENHAFPYLGSRRVDQITPDDVVSALQPIWTSKPDMARKVRQRIGKVLDYSHTKGWRPTEAPRKSVSAGLPRQPKGGHYDVMPYQSVPAYVASLRSAAPTVGRRGQLFQILTAARPGEVRGARWGQIDIAKREWKRPASLMKERVAHTVTLNSAAIALLEQVRDELEGDPDPQGLIFGSKSGKMISDATFNKVLRDAGFSHDTHGFRSSFRDWAAENVPEIPDPVAEAAIAHQVPDEVVRAYKRTTFIEMRRKLLQKWSDFVLGEKATGE